MFTPDFVCQNPSCRSYGARHPNCRCSPEGQYAQGGDVHFCTANQGHHESCEHFADGGEIASNLEFQNDPGLAVDHAIAHHGLSHALSRSGYTKSNEPGRAHAEFLDSHRRGRKALHTHSHSLLEAKPEHKPEASDHEGLETKLEHLRNDPEAGLNIGGDLDAHGPLLAAKAASAATYLQSLKPKPTPAGPLDKPSLPSKSEEKAYRRQVELAERPTLIYERLRKGDAVPADFQTLEILYPKFRSMMKNKAFELLAEAKAKGRILSCKEKRRFGALLGEPVTLQQSPMAIAAIMHANAPTQMPQPPAKQPKKATAVELKQINKVDEMAQTTLQRLQARQK